MIQQQDTQFQQQQRSSISPNLDSVLFNNSSTTASIDLNINNLANTFGKPVLSLGNFGHNQIGTFSHDFSPKASYQNSILQGFFESINAYPFEEEIKLGAPSKPYQVVNQFPNFDLNNFSSDQEEVVGVFGRQDNSILAEGVAKENKDKISKDV